MLSITVSSGTWERVTKIIEGEQTTIKMKFLHTEKDIFYWPKHDDKDIIKTLNLFFMDLLILSHVLKRRDHVNIKRLYKLMKQ